MDLYRSPNLRVQSHGRVDDDTWVVTFDDYGSANGLDRDGFGHRFFQRRGISHVTMLAAGAEWYNYSDITDALEAAAGAMAGAKRIMTYGSSMGGYAALRFAARLGATATLALSPQFTIDPVRVPFDERWIGDGNRIDWKNWIEAPIRLNYRPLIISDGRGVDKRHVELIAAETEIDHIALNYTAHPVTTFLSNVSLLEEAVLGTLYNSLDLPDYRQRAERARHEDAIYLGELARLQPAGRARTGLTLAYRAFDRAPSNPLVRTNLAVRLRTAGQLDEALEHHKHAAALSDGASGYEIEHCATLCAHGDKLAACVLASRLVDKEPSNPHLLAWAAQLHWQCGNRTQALGYAKAAHSAAPNSEYFAAIWRRYRRRQAPWRHRFMALARYAGTLLKVC